MVMSCWDVDPAKRFTVDHVLGTLTIAAEQWNPTHKAVPTQDDWDPAVSEEGSDLSTDLEFENEPVGGTSGSLDPTPVPAPAPLSIVKDTKEEEIESAPAISSKQEKPKLAIVTSEETQLASDREELRLIPAIPTNPLPVRQATEEESKPTDPRHLEEKRNSTRAPPACQKLSPNRPPWPRRMR